jgi:hypothetical protein
LYGPTENDKFFGFEIFLKNRGNSACVTSGQLSVEMLEMKSSVFGQWIVGHLGSISQTFLKSNFLVSKTVKALNVTTGQCSQLLNMITFHASHLSKTIY